MAESSAKSPAWGVPARITIADRVADVVLDHPPVNAFDSHGWHALAAAFHELSANPEINVVLLSAAGRGFCAGVDIKELARDSKLITAVNRGCYDTFAAIRDSRVPVVVAVHGFCLGGGIGMAGSADIIVASEDATFGLPEIDRGALGAASHLLRMFPIQKVRKMLLTGEPITAAEAYRLGALESVVPREQVYESARKIAESIASKSPKAVRLAKESLDGIEVFDVKKSYRFEQGFTLELYTSPDSQEARDAFVEKRDAKFDESGTGKPGRGKG
jgi:enoyl-CoA hydratase